MLTNSKIPLFRIGGHRVGFYPAVKVLLFSRSPIAMVVYRLLWHFCVDIPVRNESLAMSFQSATSSSDDCRLGFCPYKLGCIASVAIEEILPSFSTRGTVTQHNPSVQLNFRPHYLECSILKQHVCSAASKKIKNCIVTPFFREYFNDIFDCMY